MKNLRVAVVSSLAIRALNIIQPLVVTPVLVASLGYRDFGKFEVALSAASWLGISGLGLSVPVTNRLTDSIIGNDIDQTRRVFSAQLFIQLAVAVVISVCLLVSLFILNSNSGCTTVEEAGVKVLAGCTIGLVLPQVVFNPCCFYAAKSQLYIYNLQETLAKLVSIFACCFVGLYGCGLFWAVVATLLPTTIVRLASFLFLVFPFAHAKVLKIVRVDSHLIFSLLRAGATFTFVQLLWMVLYQSDVFLLGWMNGVEEVAEYVMYSKLYATAYGVYAICLFPMMTAFRALHLAGEKARIRKSVNRLVVVGFISFVSITFGFILFGAPVLSTISAGRTNEVNSCISLSFGFCMITRMWIDTHTTLLLAVDRLAVHIPILAIQVLLYALLAVPFVGTLGPAGPCFAIGFANLLCAVWVYPRLVWDLTNS